MAQRKIQQNQLSTPITVANGGTGQTTSASALNALLPTQTGNNGKFLTTDGSNTSWANTSGGTVTTLSVNTSNGFAGSVSNPTTTPAITLSTTVSGLLAGNGTAISTALSSDVTTALGYTPVNRAGDTMMGYLILNADPVSSLGAATKQYVDNIASGLTIHAAAVAATISNLSATYNNGSGGVGATLTANPAVSLPTIDGISLSIGNRVLVKNQSTQSENGVYTVTQTTSPWILTRATDFDGTPSSEIQAGDAIFVQQGTTQGDTQWVQTTTGTIIVGTTNIVFTQFGGPGTYTGGTGINVTGTVISLATSNVSSLFSLGTNGIIARTASNTVTARTISSGTGISVADGDGVSGNPTITNTGVTSAIGTVNQVNVSAATGAVTFSLPQNINTTANPTFAAITGDRFIPVGSTVPTNGLYLSAANTLALATNTTQRFTINGSGNTIINAPSSGATLALTQIANTSGFNVSDGTRTFNLGTDTGAGSVYLGAVTAHHLDLYSGNAQRMRLGSAGNVIINAPTSGTAFTVTGVASASVAVLNSNTTGGSVSIANSANSAINLLVAGTTKGIRIGHSTGASIIEGVDNTGTGSYQPLQIGGSTLAFTISNTSAIDINATRNITFNAPTSGTALTVNGLSGSSTIAISDSTVNQRWFSSGGIGYFGPSSNHELRVRTNDTDRVQIGNAGNIVVNAPTSGTALTVTALVGQNAARITDATNYTLDITRSTVFGTGLHSSAGLGLAINGSSTASLGINTSGNVTIAAPSSGIALSVAMPNSPGTGAIVITGGALGFNPRLYTELSAIGQLTSIDGITIGASTSAFTGLNGDLILAPRTSGGNAIRLYTGSGTPAERFTVNGSGNVTIAAPTSGTALTVNGLSGSSTIAISDSTVNQRWFSSGGIGYFGPSSNHELRVRTNDTDRVQIGNAGNIVVNAPTSGNTMDVYAVASTVRAIRIIQLDAAASRWSALSFFLNGVREYIIGGDTTAGNFFIRDQSLGADRMTLSSTGNFTFNAPSSGNHIVNGNLNFAASGSLVSTSTNGMIMAPALTVGRLSSGDAGHYNALHSYQDSEIYEMSVGRTASLVSGILIRAGGASAGPNTVSLWTANSTRILITSVGGVEIDTPDSGIALLVRGTIKQPPSTVASLPSASSVGSGTRHFVSDATATTFASIVAGGSTNSVPVYSDGTNWRIG